MIACPASLVLLALAVTASPAFAQAGGLYLPENGGPISGTAQAGSAAVARDAETSWLNPAGMTRLKSPELIATLMPVNLDIQFRTTAPTTIAGDDGGNQGSWIPAAGLFLAVPASDDVAFGMSVTSPAGLLIDPSDSWVGRNYVTEAKILAVNFEPSIGVRLNERWSVGLGVDLQFLGFEQKLRGPILGQPLGIDGDSWEVGLSLSALWEPSDRTRVGARYRSQMNHDLQGDFSVGGTAVTTDFTLPQSATLSMYQAVGEQLALLVDVGWTDWSAFDRNVITFDASGATVELPRNFKDTWNISLGTHWQLDERWLWMVGAGYTSSAVADRDRTPDLPVDQQVRASTGIEHRSAERWTLGANYTFAWLGENEIDQTRPVGNRLAGDYDSFAHILGVYAALRF